MSGAHSFRPLLIFWAAVVSLLMVGALWLQVLGPVRPAAPAVPRIQAAPEPKPALSQPASLPPGSQHPAPALPMVSAAIPEPDPAMLEPGTELPDRMLPRRAGPGRMPALLYAAAFDPAERHPRVALVIDGAGLDQAMTEQAMRSLPSAIDLAFSAYALPATAAELARTGRHQGRECLVSIPMEPSGFPDIEEGQRELQTEAVPEQNSRNLEWALSGVAGCVGATGGSDGLIGGRFAQSNQAMAELLAKIERQGLLYLDPRPGAPALPGVNPRVVDVIIDGTAAPEEPADAQTIDRNLAALEQVAARRGAAIGLAGPPRPVLLDRVAVWAQGLAARGLVLAPLTSIPAPGPAAPEATH